MTKMETAQIAWKKILPIITALFWFAIGFHASHTYFTSEFRENLEKARLAWEQKLDAAKADRDSWFKKYQEEKVNVKTRVDTVNTVTYVERPIDAKTGKPIASDIDLQPGPTKLRFTMNGKPVGTIEKNPKERFMFEQNYLEWKQSLDGEINLKLPVVDKTRHLAVTVGGSYGFKDKEANLGGSITHINNNGFSQNLTIGGQFVYFGLGWAK